MTHALVSKALLNNTSTVHCDERFNIVKIFDRLFVNVYLWSPYVIGRPLYFHPVSSSFFLSFFLLA